MGTKTKGYEDQWQRCAKRVVLMGVKSQFLCSHRSEKAVSMYYLRSSKYSAVIFSIHTFVEINKLSTFLCNCWTLPHLAIKTCERTSWIQVCGWFLKFKSPNRDNGTTEYCTKDDLQSSQESLRSAVAMEFYHNLMNRKAEGKVKKCSDVQKRFDVKFEIKTFFDIKPLFHIKQILKTSFDVKKSM